MRKINWDFFETLGLNKYLESALENNLPDSIEQITGYECQEKLCHIRPNEYSYLNIYEKSGEYWCSFKWTLGIIREFLDITIHLSEPFLLTPILIKNQNIDEDERLFKDIIMPIDFTADSQFKVSIDNFDIEPLTKDYFNEKLYEAGWMNYSITENFLFLKKDEGNMRKGILLIKGRDFDRQKVDAQMEFYLEDWNGDGLVADVKYGMQKVWIDELKVEFCNENELRIKFDFENAWRHRGIFSEIFELIQENATITRAYII